MTYLLEVSDILDRKLKKMGPKESAKLKIIDNKVKQILANPQHFKPLRGSMRGARRVHIDSSFVLTYEIDELRKTVRLLDFAHHDNIYG